MNQEIFDWLNIGIKNGWCTPNVCAVHDGVPSTAEEDESYISGDDPCVFVIRLYMSPEEKAAVEENHPASKWR